MTKFVLILFIFFSGLNFVLAAEISQFVFTTAPQAISLNVSSEIITIEAQDASGNPIKNNTVCLQIISSSQIGEFSTNKDNWSTEPIRILNLTLATNQYRRNFYYKDSTTGSYILTVKAVLKPEDKTCPQLMTEEWSAQWTAKQNIVISSSGGGDTTPVSTSTSDVDAAEPTSDVGSATDWPIEPQIYANAGPDKTVVVGADVYFSGQALGIKKEPLENARYLWNFGDGAVGEGKNVRHPYRYPSEYLVVLDVSSGQYSASDNLLVKVIPNQIKISEANQDFIKISNDSNVTLDVSKWSLRLRGNNNFFIFPESTLIKADSDLIISSSISGIGITEPGTMIELFYPNGSLAFSWQKSVSPPSFSEPAPSSEISSEKEIVKLPEKLISEEESKEKEVANVITLNKKSFLNTKGFLILTVILGVLSVAGLLFIRHKTIT